MLRTAFFLDGQNCYGNARRAFFNDLGPSSSGQFHPHLLANLILERKAEPHSLTGIWVYRGRPDRHLDPRGHSANVRQSNAWASLGVHVRPRQLNYPRDWPTSPAAEKGVDVWLAVDVVSKALRGEVDVVVLGTGDSDLLPAVEEVLTQTSCRVEVIGWRGPDYGQRLAVPGRNLWCNWINAADFDRIRDDTDYTRP
ncbi:MAG: NYN domain-containing protein [Dehalococcoidia bacterium]|nr:NYN domain-containing protein [Dehalococcoidia bacterium]